MRGVKPRRSRGVTARPISSETQVIPAVRASEPDVREPTIDETQVIPVVAAAEPAIADPTIDETQVIPVVTAEPVADELTAAAEVPVADVSADEDDESEPAVGRHRLPSTAVTAAAVPRNREPETGRRARQAPDSRLEVPEPSRRPGQNRSRQSRNPRQRSRPEARSPAGRGQLRSLLKLRRPLSTPNPTAERLQRLLAFVVRQEPQLNWAVGDLADGTTLLVTDLAHGWIPSGIALPAGVRLLAPGRRAGKVSALLGEAIADRDLHPRRSWSAGRRLRRDGILGAAPRAARGR